MQSSNTGQTINLAPKERKPSRYLHLKITCLPRAHKSAILMGLFWPIFAAKLMSSLLYQWYPAMLSRIHVMISIYTWFNLSRHVPLMVSGTLLKAISTLNKQIFGVEISRSQNRIKSNYEYHLGTHYQLNWFLIFIITDFDLKWYKMTSFSIHCQ